MDRFSGLKAATCIAAKKFERWSKLAALTSEASSVLHSITLLETSQLLSALLTELEADGTENERLASDLVARNGEIEGLRKRAAELEDYNTKLRGWNAGLAQESCELKAKLATPVRLPEPCVYEVNGTRFYDRLSEAEVIASLREQGLTVEGG